MRLGLASAVRTALSVRDALVRLAERPADVVLVDTALSRPDSAEFARRVSGVAPAAVLLFFGPEEARTVATAMAAGARGVIRAGEHDDVVTVVGKAFLLMFSAPVRANPRPVADGVVAGPTAVEAAQGSPASAARPVAAAAGAAPSATEDPGDPSTTNPLAVPLQRSDPPKGAKRKLLLTDRELQVLRGMADGKSNAEIGRELYVSEDTVKTHARRLFRKLGARDRAHAVATAFRAGLVS